MMCRCSLLRSCNCRITLDCAGPPWPWWPRSATKPPPCLLPHWLTRPWVKDFTLGKNPGAPTVQRRLEVEVDHLSQWRHHQQQQPSHRPLIRPPHPVLATVKTNVVDFQSKMIFRVWEWNCLLLRSRQMPITEVPTFNQMGLSSQPAE